MPLTGPMACEWSTEMMWDVYVYELKNYIQPLTDCNVKIMCSDLWLFVIGSSKTIVKNTGKKIKFILSMIKKYD